MPIRIIQDSISLRELSAIARERASEYAKAVVDVERGMMAVGGELHSDEEALLLESGSRQGDVWGIDLFPEKPPDEWIEFDSMINVRPSWGNRSRSVESQEIREKIRGIVSKLVVR